MRWGVWGGTTHVARSVACIRIRTRPLLREGTMNQPSIRTEEQQEFCVGPHCMCVRVRMCVCVYIYIYIYICICICLHVST